MTPEQAFDGTPLAERAAREIAARIQPVLVGRQVRLDLVDLPDVLPKVRSVALALSMREIVPCSLPSPMAFADVTFDFEDADTGLPPTTCIVHMQRRGTPEKGGSLWRIDSVTFRQRVADGEVNVDLSFNDLLMRSFHVHPRVRVLTQAELDREEEQRIERVRIRTTE